MAHRIIIVIFFKNVRPSHSLTPTSAGLPFVLSIQLKCPSVVHIMWDPPLPSWLGYRITSPALLHLWWRSCFLFCTVGLFCLQSSCVARSLHSGSSSFPPSCSSLFRTISSSAYASPPQRPSTSSLTGPPTLTPSWSYITHSFAGVQVAPASLVSLNLYRENTFLGLLFFLCTDQCLTPAADAQHTSDK